MDCGRVYSNSGFSVPFTKHVKKPFNLRKHTQLAAKENIIQRSMMEASGKISDEI